MKDQWFSARLSLGSCSVFMSKCPPPTRTMLRAASAQRMMQYTLVRDIPDDVDLQSVIRLLETVTVLSATPDDNWLYDSIPFAMLSLGRILRAGVDGVERPS